MKLIDLLAIELTTWPTGNSCGYCVTDNCGEVFFGYPVENLKLSRVAEDHETARVTREQWNAARWNGEGLPPVGTVCEIKHEREWRKCEIIAHKTFDDGSKTHAIAWIDANNIDQSQGIRFRRLPTAEQIAADEERERALAVMLQDSIGEDGSAIQDDVARRLYAAGYRKVQP